MINKLTEIGIVRLAATFPSLERADGIWPWNPNRLDGWASRMDRTNEERLSARFLLQVWNPSFDWECGLFDTREAIQYWDTTHRRAFLEFKTINTLVSN